MLHGGLKAVSLVRGGRADPGLLKCTQDRPESREDYSERALRATGVSCRRPLMGLASGLGLKLTGVRTAGNMRGC